GTISGKGVINNKMSNMMMQMLEKKGIPTHFVEQIDDRNTVVKKVQIVPLEVIIRNVAAGSFSKKYGVVEGTKLANPTIEVSYKNDDLGDPLINNYHALALNLATKEEIDTITKMAFAVNDAMKAFFKQLKIDLIDFKLEFGRFKGQIVLADEISPDTCRFWEADSWDTTKHVSLDKDRFRRDLGGVEDAYQEVFKRLTGE
ncbi:MAG: phosphoribosylaminoimidazolesuccinocarboxamide synthase, partial [Clostridia bacterium]|nr:phosphoribosylaminoimidazolesuccinocarboxamide synthase [Clostridia bacterium]